LMAPKGPQGFEDSALGVEPRMGGGAALGEGSLIKIPDRALLAFGSLEKGAIGDGFEEGVALTVELFKAQRFAVAGLVADGEAAEAGELGEIVEAIRIHEDGHEEMSADDADTGEGFHVLDFRERSAGLEQERRAWCWDWSAWSNNS